MISTTAFPFGASDDFDFGAKAVRFLLQRGDWPTAFLTMSDEAGVATVHELKSHGVEVPRQASVIAFDDSRLCAFVSPPLTVVSIPYERMGREAAAVVHRRLDDNLSEKFGQNTTVGGDLIVRESTGAAPANPPQKSCPD